MTIWDPRNETMSREDLGQLQLERLQATLHRVQRSVAFYRRRFAECGFDPDELRSLDELRRLPCTTRAELVQHHPYGLFAVPLREVVRLHASSSAGGRPVVVGHTARDIRTWGELAARVLVAGGVTRDDVVQIAFDYGMFPDGFGFHYGAERVGASVIPTSAARTAHQIGIMRDYRSTVLLAPPSVARALAAHLAEEGVDPTGLSLRVGIFCSEPWDEDLRVELESGLMLKAADAYAVGEVLGPGVAGECPQRTGLHLQEDHFIAEVVDPATGEPRPPGVQGELVLTTLTREAFPLIRYRTGDLTRLDPEPCGCGRTLARLARVAGRTDDMISVRGVHFFPGQIAAILTALTGTAPRFAIALRREGGQDCVEVRLEVSGENFFDEMRRQRLMVEEAGRRVREEIGIPARIRLVEPRSLGGEGTAPRVVDER
ncbi:MAG TPA: phenylacetate--CoA ligase [Candidatus Methanoperedens sp.]|nr:phenylacetate--CoA ligase [Candidatus Methanoperedens sp.]